MGKSVILVGYSGHGFVAYGILTAMGKKITGYCETEEKNYNPFLLNYIGKELSGEAIRTFHTTDYFISVGSNLIRESIFFALAQHKLYPINAVHPSAVIDPSVQIDPQGILIAANATINPLVKIGPGVICNTSCSIDHECLIGDFAHIAPGAVLCGNVTVGSRSFIGANAVIRQGISIGSNVMIGAGSVIITDVPDNSCFIGNPGKKK